MTKGEQMRKKRETTEMHKNTNYIDKQSMSLFIK